MARYDGMRKLERNIAIKEYVKDNPDLSLKEVGAFFGISGSRVWVIVNGKKHKGDKNAEQVD